MKERVDKTVKPDLKIYEDKMKKTISVYEEDLAGIRVGRASSRVLDKVSVAYYGVPTPVNQVADIKATDPKTLLITPWDPSVLKALEKAIQASDVGITPMNDGRSIRLVFPALTEDRRKELTKQVRNMGEDAKVALRNIRREANEKGKELKKTGEMTEDDEKENVKDVQELTDKYIKEADKVTERKKAEIMEI